ncbi:MAG: hypothetical protein SNG81_07895 [Rikenellaceae bacterium]
MKQILKITLSLLVALSVSHTLVASNPDSDKFIQALEYFEKYSDTQWTEHMAIPGTGYWGNGFSGERAGLKPGYTPNDAIRSMNGVALANAVLIMANPDSPLNEKRLDKIVKVLRYASLTHKMSGTDYKCVDGYQWGLGWQSNMWAGSMGFTCALLEDKIPSDVVAQVKKIVGVEADFRSETAPASEYRGNTAAEENAWNSNIVALAAAWLSDDQRAAKWLEAAKIYMVNTYSVEVDKSGEMGSWASSINLYPSFMLENHGFYHPGYHSVSGSSLGDSFLMTKLTNDSVAEELTPFVEHNVLSVWEKLKNVVKSNSELFYPCGQDWSLHGYGHVAYASFIATHFQQAEAVDMQNHIIDLLLSRQNLFGTGEFIGKSNENTFYVEAVTARRIALAWLHNYTNDFKLVTPQKMDNFSNHADDVKIITSRSDKGNISLSYGRRILLAVDSKAGNMPQTQYIYCSSNMNLIGYTPFGTAVSAELIDCNLMEDGFTASLNVKAQYGSVDFEIYAKRGVVAIIQKPVGEPLCEAKCNSFVFDIENYIMNGAKRDFYSAEGITEIEEASGLNRQFGSVINISDDYGVIYGPTAKSSYVAPQEYNRRGASVDTIGAVLENPFAPSYAIILCNETWEATELSAESVSFTVAKDNKAILRFVTPDGELVELSK